MTAHTPDTVVLIHGIGATPLSWEHWGPHYEVRGFRVLMPGYPGIGPGEEGVAAIRRDPSPLAGLGVQEIADHLAAAIEGLETPPIIIGHSFGGLFVQLLLDRGLGCVGVSINGAGPQGVKRLPISQLRSVFPFLRNPLKRNEAIAFTEKNFHYGVTNNLTASEARPFYDRYVIPVSARMLFQAGFANFNPKAVTKIDWANADRAPLLFISGGNDHILPASVQHENYRRHAKRSRAVTAYRNFPGRDHLTCGEPGWENVADFALDWSLAPVSGNLSG